MSDNPCPCSGGVFPLVVFNPPAQPSIAYRWGDYDGFRGALLQTAQPPLPAETQLTRPDGTLVWRPAPDSGDLALQIAEWWAYLSDILTLYTERAANQAFLGTADLPESLPRLRADPRLPPAARDRGAAHPCRAGARAPTGRSAARASGAEQARSGPAAAGL